MTTTAQRLVDRIAQRGDTKPIARRGLLASAAMVGAAVAVNPWGFLVRPASAYDAVCGAAPACSDGYSVFCCTINKGINSCPPNSFIGGWWKADRSSFCGGSARYYIDCNAYRNGAWKCHCASGTCDSRRVACNQFRYGQCSPQVPYENTGPVVCRIVSCTPPWKQFAGVCSSTSLTDNKTATHSAPCVGVAPRGALDTAVGGTQSIRVRGWAFDADQPASSLTVTVLIDGVAVASAAAAIRRPDVDSTYRISGAHGFDLTVPAKPGRHTVSVSARNIAGGRSNTTLGSRAVLVVAPAALPIGRVDSVTVEPSATSASGRRLRIRGWALDRDQPGTAINIAVRIDNGGGHWFATTVLRPDVNSTYRATGPHGFDATLDIRPGQHRVDVYGINVGGGHGNPPIGGRTVVVPG